MKKITLLFSAMMCFSFFTFAQVQEGDIKLLQQYYGTEKMAVVKDYMDLTPAQDSVFWDDYNAYEKIRLELGKRRIQLIDKYAKDLMALNADNATDMVNEANAIDVEFKKLQKTYFKKMSKSIGVVKAAQFYQFEAYLNNAINLSIQENIPFVGELQKYRKQK
jgi:hypothetical protein